MNDTICLCNKIKLLELLALCSSAVVEGSLTHGFACACLEFCVLTSSSCWAPLGRLLNVHSTTFLDWITLELCTDWVCKLKRIPGDNINIRTAYAKWIHKHIQSRDIEFNSNLLIVPNLIYNLILGVHTLVKLNATLTFGRNRSHYVINIKMHKIILSERNNVTNNYNDEVYQITKSNIKLYLSR